MDEKRNEEQQGWRCPCCLTIYAPTHTTCFFCSPVLRLVFSITNPEEYAKFETYHECPASAMQPAKK